MIVKKFQAPTEKEAILKAKDELGSNAVVLNVKTLKQRGVFRLFKKDVVEITAALEENDFIDGINKKKPTFNKNTSNVINSRMVSDSSIMPQLDENKAFGQMMPGSTISGGIDLVADDTIKTGSDTSAIEQKLDSLQQMLKQQIDNNNAYKPQTPQRQNYTSAKNNSVSGQMHQDNNEEYGRNVIKERESANYKYLQLIYNKMIDSDVAPEYADEIIGDIESSLKKESNIDSILAAVYQKIILKLGQTKSIQLGNKPQIVMFIGPTGVGKTTTIAKIASAFKLEKQAKVAFITSDTYRIAAVEQLNTYASIIDCPVSVVYTNDELVECVDKYKNYDLIMIDTAGRSHKAEGQMEELEDLVGVLKQKKDEFDLDIYLTLSITTKYKDLMSICDRYKNISDWGLIFTKLDETCVMGNMLNIELYTGAPLSYTTSGQNVPNDIEIIDKQALAKHLLGGSI